MHAQFVRTLNAVRVELTTSKHRRKQGHNGVAAIAPGSYDTGSLQGLRATSPIAIVATAKGFVNVSILEGLFFSPVYFLSFSAWKVSDLISWLGAFLGSGSSLPLHSTTAAGRYCTCK